MREGNKDQRQHLGQHGTLDIMNKQSIFVFNPVKSKQFPQTDQHKVHNMCL